MRLNHITVLSALAALLLSACNVDAQTNVRETPDCSIPFSFTATGSTATFDNRVSQCTVWYLAYDNSGFSALSIVAQNAPNSGGSAGSWSTFSASIGSNPSTATTQAEASFAGYFPFLRVTLSSVTGSGTVQGKLIGWRKNQASAAAGGGATSNVNVQQVGGTSTVSPGLAGVIPVAGAEAAGGAPSSYPVQTAQLDGSGNILRDFRCTASVAINTSASGNTQLVAAVAGKTIRVCNVLLVAASPVTIQLQQGTGVACATGTANLTGAMPSVSALGFDPAGALQTNASQAICINLGSAVSTQGILTYAQF